MNDKPLASAADYNNPRLYTAASRLRQRPDAAWVFEALPHAPVNWYLDIGCGDGSFLQWLVREGRVTLGAVGIDNSDAMVEAARGRMLSNAAGVDVNFVQANVLDPFSSPRKFDLVTMLAVMHWLYPKEAQALRWIKSVLQPDGVFLLTTYHPAVDRLHRGGSDEVVLQAMARMGLPRVFPNGFVPMGVRARPKTKLEGLLGSLFQIEAVSERSAVTLVPGPKAYLDYHIATFGSYYLQLFSERDRDRFRLALGVVAEERMQALGFVTSMQVRLWVCRVRKNL